MQIECPSCGTAYEVPDHILARKRTMRCARCARDWSPAPAPVAEAAAPPPAAIAPRQEAPKAAALPRASAGRKAAILGAWGASLCVLALAGWWGVMSQSRIVRAWPASARLYAVVGRQAK